MITVLTDLAVHLTQNVLLATDQRVLKLFFDIPKKTRQGNLPKLFHRGRLFTNFERSPRLGFSGYQKMVFGIIDQWPKVHLVSNVQLNL